MSARRFPLHAQIMAGVAAGLVLGPLLGKPAMALGEAGRLVVQLIKAAATPLLFLAITNAVLKTTVRPRSALRLLAWAALNASIALGIGLAASNLLEPGRTLAGLAHGQPVTGAAAQWTGKQIDVLATIRSFVPASLVTPFAENLILTIIVIALVFGLALRRVRAEQNAACDHAYQVIEGALATLLRVTEVALGWVLKFVPLAVFGVVTAAVAEHGYAPLKGLAIYVVVAVGGLLVHIAVIYQLELRLLARIPLGAFWRAAREPVAHAAGANSSLATLPVTLRALDRLGVSRSASTLGACVGTNFNNDGIILYEGMAVLFVAQASGIDLSLGQQVVAAAACLVAAMGVAGVPEAGFVSLALVLNTVGLPLEILPLLLTVDWIVARARSVANVLSDMVLSVLIDRLRSEPPGTTS